MPLLFARSSATAPLTMEERAASAAATTEAALVVFANAATDLETAAAELDQLAEDAHAEELKNYSLRRDAVTSAERNRARAAQIRESFSF